MEENQFIRSEMLFGKRGMEKLFSSRVAVFGVGGVGGYAVEALARAGIGTLCLVDNDVVNLSNLNRQIIATHATLGMYKTKAAEQRIKEINPNCTVQTREMFVLPENINEFDFSSFDYIIDAVDTVSAKIAVIVKATEENIPVISCMGAGNKTDPTKFVVTDIYSTSVCPLARVMRTELRKRGIQSLKVVYSTEPPFKPDTPTGKGKPTPASNSFVPAVAGLIAAGEVIRNLACGQ